MSFIDRQNAGNRLADLLEKYRRDDVVVFALPRGGVEVALPIALRLSAPLDLLLVRKIGAPHQPEVAMGAIVDGDHPAIVRNEDVVRYAGVSETTFQELADQALKEIERRRHLYLAGRSPAPVAGKTAIVVDDGVATGATLKAALMGLKASKPARIVVAMPVAPVGFSAELQSDVDEFICLEELCPVGAVGAHYAHFDQLSDADVIRLLEAAKR